MKKPDLSFWQIWNMSFGFLGIQFGFALQNANTSRIFETLGADVDKIGLYWLAAPVTGLLVQPIVGYFSDKTWTRFGRRKPYFMIGALLASLSLFIMPNSPALWVAIGTLWMMDSSINITMEPFRAFVGDNLNEKQRPLGFFTQSFFIGVGAVVGSALPYIFSNWIGLSNVAEAGLIPESVKWSFYCGGIVFLLAVLWTVFRSAEYSPEELERFEGNVSGEVTATPVSIRKQVAYGLAFMTLGLLTWQLIRVNDLDKELLILSGGLAMTGLLFLLAGLLRQNRISNGFTDIITGLLDMPATMKQLALVQFFTWFALFAMWIYTTQAVTGHVFDSHDPTSKVYNDAADWVSIMFAFYSLVCAVAAFALPKLVSLIGNRKAHLLALTLGGLGLISIYFATGRTHLILAMIGVGIAWASILSVPYTLLSNALPAARMGYYMGVFNFFIVIPQIVAGTILGFVLKTFFGSEPVYALIIGGVSMIVAGILTLFVRASRTAS